MNTLSSFVKQHRLVSFIVLAYALSWWVPLLNVEGLPPVAAFGPFLAALIVLGLTVGRSGVKTLLGRMVRWRVGLQWYLIALGLPILLGGLASYLAVLLGAPAPARNNLAVGLQSFLPSQLCYWRRDWAARGKNPAGEDLPCTG